MRAGRLPEIIFGKEKIRVLNTAGSKESATEWILMDFCSRFPNTEINKVGIGKGYLKLYVYDFTAMYLKNGEYDKVYKMSDEVEYHCFDSDIDYIKRVQEHKNAESECMKN